VSRDQIFWVFGAAFGAWLMIHCPRAAVREYKRGVAEGLNPFPRDVDPVGFWVTIVGTFLAGVMGLFFFLFGIVAIFAG